MSLFAPRLLPLFPVLDPQFQWEERLNREDREETISGFNPLSQRNVGSETGKRGSLPRLLLRLRLIMKGECDA